VALPARTRIFAPDGIGEIVVRPCAASSDSVVVCPLRTISPSMPWPKWNANSSPCGATIGNSGDGALSVANSTPDAVPMR
jgi:hypothetical protein